MWDCQSIWRVNNQLESNSFCLKYKGFTDCSFPFPQPRLTSCQDLILYPKKLYLCKITWSVFSPSLSINKNFAIINSWKAKWSQSWSQFKWFSICTSGQEPFVLTIGLIFWQLTNFREAKRGKISHTPHLQLQLQVLRLYNGTQCCRWIVSPLDTVHPLRINGAITTMDVKNGGKLSDASGEIKGRQWG